MFRRMLALVGAACSLLAGAAIPAATALAAAAPAAAVAQTSGCNATSLLVKGASERVLMSGGLERRYILYVPGSYDTARAVPLVVSLHGLNSNAGQQERYSRWDEIAEREGFITVYPQGTGDPAQWESYPRLQRLERNAVDDVQFIRDLLAQISADTCIDPARVFVNGISNGGAMAVRLGCELSDQIAALGTVAAAVLKNQTCQPPTPVPLIAFHGTADPLVAYDGGMLFAPSQSWTEDWAAGNGCTSSEALPQIGEVSGVQYQNCRSNAEVIAYTIAGGGHTWPGAPAFAFIERRLGHTTQDIDATEAMWTFFSAHPRES